MKRQPPPSLKTLARYGLAVSDWDRIGRRQGWACGVCGESRLLVIDHEHAPGWKRLPPADRRRYVRGLACRSCNHFVITHWADADKHRGAAAYLDAYAERKDRP